LIDLMFRSFGQEPPAVTGARRALLWLLASLFVLSSLAILAFVNVFSLFAGVTMNFLGRDGVRFRFLQFFRRVPVIGVTLPILFFYAAWNTARGTGAMAIAWPTILTVAVAILLIGGVCIVNALLKDRRPGR